MASLGLIIFLVARNLPRISETETAQNPKTKTNWFSSVPFEKIDATINTSTEKMLRKIKLILMKMDNTVSKQLNKFKKNGDDHGSGNGLTK
jgi:hypothetical protein